MYPYKYGCTNTKQVLLWPALITSYKSHCLMRRIFGLLITLFVLSCGKKGGECEEAIDATRTSEIVILFKDKVTGRYLYSELNPMYSKENLQITDLNGNKFALLSFLRSAPDNNNQGVYYISFGAIYNSQTDFVAFDREICKTFLVNYNSDEVDTLETCFRLMKTRCGAVFSPIKVYKNGCLLDSSTASSDSHITFYRN